MLKKIKDWYKRDIKRERDKLIQIMQLDGHVFYCLDALPNYVVNRFFYFVSKNEEIQTLGVPKEYYLSIADQIDTLVGNEKASLQLPKLAELIRFAIGKTENKWYWLTVACIEAFILIDDEPLNEISPDHNKIKRELLNKNPEIRFFFTNIATEYLRNLDATFTISNYEEYWKNLITVPGEIEELFGTETIQSHSN